MNRLAYTLAALAVAFVGAAPRAQVVVRYVEYYVDTDPGMGQATPVPVTPADSVEASFTLDTEPLAPGPHRIAVRARDSRGAWSPVAHYVFVKQGVGGEGEDAIVTYVEYFLDVDPGRGLATAVPITPGDSVEAAFAIDTAPLAPGPHRIFVRARDSRGAWSPVGHYVFVKQGVGGEGEDAIVTYVEYFLGPDPGLGQATPVPVTPGDSAEASFTLDTAPLPAGVHRIAVRARDSRGAWSPVAHYVFVKSGTSDLAVDRVEYFFDSDPGVGNGTAVPLTPAPDVELSFVADVSALTPGAHTISVRARSTAGAWSLVAGPTPFTVGPSTTYTWTGATNSDWNDPENWEPFAVPGPADTAVISEGPPALLSGDVAVAGLSVGPGGTLGGAGDVVVSGAFSLLGGQLLGSGTVTAQGTATLNGGALVGRSLQIAGTGTLPDFASGLTLDGGARLVVAEGAVLEAGISDEWQVNIIPSGTGGTLVNDGTFRLRSGSDGAVRVAVPFTNAGTLDVAGGTFVLDAPVTNSGVIGGSGTVLVRSADTITNTGRVAPGSGGPGLLSIDGGDFPLPAPSTLEIEIGGRNVGLEYDRLDVQEEPTLGGTLEVRLVNGFQPALGDTFRVLVCRLCVGTFGTFNAPALGGGLRFDTTYTATDLTLVVVEGADPNQAPVAVADVATTGRDTPVLIAVLANDTDPDGDPLALVGVGVPEFGTAEVAGDSVRYTPATDFSGEDGFSYTISDGRGGTATGVVSVTVTDVTITAEPTGPVASGGDAAVVVTVSGGFTPTVAELRYRMGGQRTFAAVPLEQNGSDYQADIPAEAVTARGVDYYVFLSDATQTVTFPAVNPEVNPVHVRVAVGQTVAAVAPLPEAAYRMVSVPVALADGSVAAVFGNDYGDYDPTLWRLLRWLPGENRYAEGDALGIAPGAAFWLAARTTNPFDVENGQSVDASGPVTLALEPGWNQIGSPFAFPVAWASVARPEGVGAPVAHDGAEYLFDQTVLDPWIGYFVENTADGPAEITVNAVSADGLAPSPPANAVAGYRLRLSAAVPQPGGGRGLRDTQNWLVLAEAEGARRDQSEPPPVGRHVRLSVVRGDARLARSHQLDGGQGAAWEVELTASPELLGADALTVAVGLVDEGERPAGYSVYVLDLDRTAALPTDGGAVELTLTEEAPLRRLRVIVGTEAFAEGAAAGIPLEPLVFALGQAFPNPAAHAATVPYTVAERTQVVLEVFDVLGRRVALLHDGEQDAGRYAARWDGAGRAASGTYLVRLRTDTFTATRPLTLLR